MRTAWKVIYDVVLIPSLAAALRLAALGNGKIRRGLQGRRGLFATLEAAATRLKPGKRIWVHSSSMGEFEQAKPIIAALKQRHPDTRIIVSFFSPSGYDHSRSYKRADIITYIPFDTSANARRFLDVIRPDAAVMVRYDVWPNHIHECGRRGIPVFLANATMRATSPRLRRPWRSFHRHLYDQMTAILTVSAADAENFAQFRTERVVIAPVGETRYDQVLQRSAEARKRHLIPPSILKKKRVIVAGSTWPEDEEVLLPTVKKLLEYDPGILLILVPHEPSEEALDQIERTFGNGVTSIRFSDLNDYDGEQVIIVDSVGILMALYQYAHVAYVGGSFKQNVHNVLEPAVYGIPVIYGPKCRNSQEAITLATREGGFIVQGSTDLYRLLRTLLADPKARTKAGTAALRLVEENAGATERFLGYLEPVLWPAPPRKRRSSS
jgi:3-deoxy-D-manno-octulosonic-acid transferase